MKNKIYKFQEDGVSNILRNWQKHKAQCLAWYTGAGKTNVFIEVCSRLIKDNPKLKIGISAYLTKEIKFQIYERLVSFGLKDISHLICSKDIPLDKNIYIFNPQSIYRDPPPLKFDYFIIDESHVGISDDTVMIKKIMAFTCEKETKLLLVSATPWDMLLLKQFKGIPVFKRPLDQGLNDGLIADFKFHAEEAQIEFTEEDFTRKGDLGINAAQRQMALLKSACIGKMSYLIKNKDLGRKVLVICPPGNASEVARSLQNKFGGLYFLESSSGGHLRWVFSKTGIAFAESSGNLNKFKEDKNIQFLFVTNKCSVGFDMQNLDSVIDLTMTRNIKVLAQRAGRIARKNGDQKKNYFYVYDKSLMKGRLEWLVLTMIDFCLGHYDGWNSKTIKYAKTTVSPSWKFLHPYSVSLSEIVKALREKGGIENQRSLSWVTKSGPPTIWTLARAKEEAKNHNSRTDMWANQPALYKWFRLNAKDELDILFPQKYKKWTEERVISILKEHSKKMSWREFRLKYGGAVYWMQSNKRLNLRLKYFPSIPQFRWTSDLVLLKLKEIKHWQDIRSLGGLRSWMFRNKGERYWQDIWMTQSDGVIKDRELLKYNKGSMRERVLRNIKKNKRRAI